VPGIDLDEYVRTLLERFASPHVRDTLARLCAFASDRIPAFVLPVVRDRLAAGGDVPRCAAVVAGWARYAEGVDEAGEPFQVVDALADELVERARRARSAPEAFLADERVFGDLAGDPRFGAAFAQALASVHEHGARRTVEALAGDGAATDVTSRG
jgi:mannitol 2-dehydrogenase